MKTNRFIFFALLLIPFAGKPLQGQEQQMSIRGSWTSDQRIRMHDPYPWSWSENRLDLGLKKNFSDKASFQADVWLRSFGFPFLTSTDQLFNKDESSPYNLDIREAWLDLYGFLLPQMDLRIGRQVITWGRGDRLNPTRSLNPLDLEDVWDFGRYHGVEAVKLDYYLNNDFFLQGVYVPFFRPATLPRGDLSAAFSGQFGAMPGTGKMQVSDSLILPELRPASSSSFGFKAGGFLLGFDLSVSYALTHDGLPLPSSAVVSLTDTVGNMMVQTELIFPRYHIAGADLAGSLAGIGIWAEGAMLVPAEEYLLNTDLSSIGLPGIESVALEKKPFFRYLIGADYTFRDGSYLNFQFLHGFFHERGKGNLNDYFIVEWQKKLFRDRLSISPVSGAFVVGDWKDIGNDFALVWAPVIKYFPNDNTELGIGVRLIGGKGNTAFAGMKDRDEVFGKAVFYF